MDLTNSQFEEPLYYLYYHVALEDEASPDFVTFSDIFVDGCATKFANAGKSC
jgi:hypothetical protein